MDVSMSRFTLDAEAAAFNAALLVAIASAILFFLTIFTVFMVPPCSVAKAIATTPVRHFSLRSKTAKL
jgi:hypothetical protein